MKLVQMLCTQSVLRAGSTALPRVGTCVIPSIQVTTQTKRRYAEFVGGTASESTDNREKVVILGSGWGGYVLANKLDPKKYRVLVVSPRSYFVFTPLLNDTAVGTLEFRNVLESVRKRDSNIELLQGWADDVNFKDKLVSVEPSILDPDVGFALTGERKSASKQEVFTTSEAKAMNWEIDQVGRHGIPVFPIKYDKLVVAVGSYCQTFNTKGVKENALFLKDVNDARKIRTRILQLFELARLPSVTDEVRSWLLHFAIVGGGPTGMEFAACLSDLLRQDLSRLHPDLMKFVKITLYDVAPKVLPMFDAALADYAIQTYQRANIEIKTSHQVEELRKGFPNSEDRNMKQEDLPPNHVYTLRTKQEGDVGIGMCVWSTGLMNNPFIAKSLNHIRKYPDDSAKIVEGEAVEDTSKRQWAIKRHPKIGSMIVDDHLRVQLETEMPADAKPNEQVPYTRAVMQDVFAIGDCAMPAGSQLPATAQVANQEALYLAKTLNKASGGEAFEKTKAFDFHSRGVMTFVGGSKAVVQAPGVSRDGAAKGLKGRLAFFVWRGAYLSMTMSWRNMILIPIQWATVKLFGRSISRF